MSVSVSISSQTGGAVAEDAAPPPLWVTVVLNWSEEERLIQVRFDEAGRIAECRSDDSVITAECFSLSMLIHIGTGLHFIRTWQEMPGSLIASGYDPEGLPVRLAEFVARIEAECGAAIRDAFAARANRVRGGSNA